MTVAGKPQTLFDDGPQSPSCETPFADGDLVCRIGQSNLCKTPFDDGEPYFFPTESPNLCGRI
jgi:hypothetical protein